MTTNKYLERLAGQTYPRAMRHLQQLLMDAEACAKTRGQKTWLGGDKFEKPWRKFNLALIECTKALIEDGKLDDATDALKALSCINEALLMLQEAYSSWPLAFKFWNDFYGETASAIKPKPRATICACQHCGADVGHHIPVRGAGTRCNSCGRFSQLTPDGFMVGDPLTIRCPNCEQKLRYPTGKEVELTCPKCKHSFNPCPEV